MVPDEFKDKWPSYRMSFGHRAAFYVLEQMHMRFVMVAPDGTLLTTSSPHGATLFTSQAHAASIRDQLSKMHPNPLEARFILLHTRTHEPNVLVG